MRALRRIVAALVALVGVVVVAHVVALVLAISAFFVKLSVEDVDHQAWLDDFDLLVRHTSAVYPNLEWVQEHRHLDLKKLHDETRAAINDARIDGDAEDAIKAFVESFGDDHFRIVRPRFFQGVGRWLEGRDAEVDAAHKPVTDLERWRVDAPSLIRKDSKAAKACAELGFHAGDSSFRFSLPPGARRLDADGVALDFPTAVVVTSSGLRLGLLRIPDFMRESYVSACMQAWESWQSGSTGDCDESCQHDLRYVDVERAILAAVTVRIEQLREEQVDMLVVDVCGNAGGHTWADTVAQMTTPTTLPCARKRFIKHPHWEHRFERQRRWLTRTLPESQESTAQLDRMGRLIAEAAERCDRAAVWRGRDPGCTLLGATALSSCDEEFAVVPPSAEEQSALSPPALWEGRLAVIVDGGTASAAAHFSALLQDAGAASIVGEHTAGAGGGYSEGGVPVVLPHSGWQIEIPDFLELRANGDNEMEGVQPDVVVPREEFSKKLWEALAHLPR